MFLKILPGDWDGDILQKKVTSRAERYSSTSSITLLTEHFTIRETQNQSNDVSRDNRKFADLQILWLQDFEMFGQTL